MPRPPFRPFPSRLLALLLAAFALPAAAQLPGMNNVVINQIQPDMANGQGLTVELYNYGPNQALDGWTLEFLLDQGGPSAVSSAFTIPASQTIPRHGFFRMHWAAGTNGYLNIYRGAGALTLTPGGELRLCSAACNGSNGVDYLRWGASAFNNLPGNLAFRGSVAFGSGASQGYMERQRDANSRSAGDWTLNQHAVDALLNPGQYGVRRHGLLLINEVNTQGGNRGVEIANPQEFAVDLTGMTLFATQKDGFFCFQQPLNGMLPSQGFYVVQVFGCSWAGGPGEAMITDAGGEGIDYMGWGGGTQMIPSGTVWTGSNIPSGWGLYYRTSTLDSDNYRDFSYSGGGSYSPGSPNPQQQFGAHYQEFGGEALSSTVGSGLGAGTQVTMSQTVALTEFRVRANNQTTQLVGLAIYASADGGVNWSSIWSTNLGSIPVENRVFHSGPLSVTLTAGNAYRFMIYGSSLRLGQFRDGGASSEFFRYGTVNGMASDNSGFLPASQAGSTLSTTFALQGMAFSMVGTPVVMPATVPDGQTGVYYSQQFTNGDGGAVSSWSYTGTAVPGLAFSTATGALTGYPTTPGSYNFTVSATSAGMTGSRNYTLNVTYLYDPLAVSTAGLPGGQLDLLYSQPLAATGGGGGNVWTLAAGALPQGIELTPDGLISGMPLVIGTSNFTVRVTDNQGATATRALSIVVTAPLRILNSTLPAGYKGVVYPATPLAAAGGSGTGYTYALISGALPPGVTFSAGALGGKPTTPGNYPLTFRVTDSLGATATRAYTLAVTEAPPIDQWESRALFGGEINTLVASPNFTTDNTAFAAGKLFEIFRSGDGGMNWTRRPVLTSALSRPVEQIVISPVFDATAGGAAQSTLFAFNSSLGVYRSLDQGNSFAAYNGGLPNLGDGNLSGLAISPDYATTGRLWVCYSNNSVSPARVDIYTIYNGLANWAYLASMSDASFSYRYGRLYISPTFSSDVTMFALVGFGIGGSRFLKSVNGGLNWSSLTGPGATTCGSTAASFRNVIISPRYAIDRTLFVEDACTVLTRSIDGGASFTTLAQRGSALAALARPALPPLWFVKNSNAIYGLSVSDTQGDHFTPVYAGGLRSSFACYICPQNPVNAIAPVRRADGTAHLLSASDRGIDGSFDGGQTFNPRERGVAAMRAASGGFGIGVRGYNGKLVALNVDHWLYSADGGAHWVRRLPPWPPDAQGFLAGVDAAAIAPSGTGNTIYLAGNQQLWRSTDSGLTFSQIPSVTQYANDIAFANGGATVFIGAQAGLYKSTNSGVSFTLLTSLANTDACTPGGGDEVRSVSPSPNYATDNTLFVGTSTVCRSVNGGSTWTTIAGAPGMSRIAPSATYNQNAANNTNFAWTLYAGGNSALYRSQDRGATWTSFALPTADFYWNAYASPAQATDHKVYAYSWGPAATLYRSLDDGASFAPLVSPDTLHTRPVTGLFALDATNWVAATDGGGLWSSTDGGASFSSQLDYRTIDAKLNALAMRPITTTFSEWVAAKNSRPDAPAAAAPQEGDLVAATDQGVFISTDGGQNFDLLSAGLDTATKVTALSFTAATPANPLVIARAPGAAASTAQVFRLNGTSWGTSSLGPGNWNALNDAGSALYATRLDGIVKRSTDGGLTWNDADTLNDIAHVAYNASSSPTLSDSTAKAPASDAPAAVNIEPYWSVSATAGARSSPTGLTGTWTAAPGSNDYQLPVLNGVSQSWRIAQPLGINAASGSREVLAGSSNGLYRTTDGGATWRRIDVAGSGLEASSRNFSAVLTTVTASGSTDLLIGATGTTTGGVYLSGDGGEHWTQINAGFDPAQLSISTLAKTSCSGCPVQYYSGSYGGGLYTRTVTVAAAPAITGWFYGSTSGGCANAAAGGPINGGQPFRLCGSGFQAGATVEFDGAAAAGCTAVTAAVITCTGTPAHIAGAAVVRVRNPDTRAGTQGAAYLYSGGASRTVNSLRVGKSAGDAALTWSCAGCSASAPARVFRAQNASLSVYLENYNGGTGGGWSNTGAVATPYSYFWSVE